MLHASRATLHELLAEAVLSLNPSVSLWVDPERALSHSDPFCLRPRNIFLLYST